MEKATTGADGASEVRLVSRELSVENTTYCAADCYMCPRDVYEHGWQHMDNALFESVIEQGVDLGMESLDSCGFGDSFMDPDYGAKLRWVKKTYPELRIFTSTTGNTLTGPRLEYARQLIDTLRISFYGYTKESYEAVHRANLRFEKVKKNVLALLEIPRNRRPFVILQFLVLPENQHETRDWIAFWEPLADEVMVWMPHNYAGGRYFGHREEAAERGLAPRSCGRPEKGSLFVRVNGEISMCCFDFNRKLTIGDLRTHSLREILAGERLRHIRAVHASGEFEGSGLLCEGCDQLYDRSDKLVYANNPARRPGVLNTHPDFINDLSREANR